MEDDTAEFMLFLRSNDEPSILSLLSDVGDCLRIDEVVADLVSPCLDRLRLRCDSIRTEAGVPDRANVRFQMASSSLIMSLVVVPPLLIELLRLLEVLLLVRCREDDREDARDDW